MLLLAPRPGRCQAKADAAPATPSTDTPDYPDNRAGVLIQGADWAALDSTMPAKTRAKNGIAQSLSYGAVRGTIVADYAGEHAAVQVKPGRVMICVCRLLSIPGDPVIVKLHPQKGGMRELDGGKLPILGGKLADASKNDLIPLTVTHPENGFWVVQSQDALPEGEYALMFGTQNVNIFPFTVSAVPSASASPATGSR
jgi:hypothetical protein